MDSVSELSYRASVAGSARKCFASWSIMPAEEWVEEIYRLPNGMRFRWDYAPYALGMFRSLFDPSVIETDFMVFSRGLKSTVILVAIGYTMDQRPRRILSLWPTNSQAEKWSKDILTGELFDTTAPLNYLGTKAQRRTGGNTLLHKAFPGGLIDIFGANAPGDMRRAKGSFLYGDEIDAIDSTVTDEGDQLAIFSKRGDEYPDSIRVFASYPSIKGLSRISAKLEESDFNQWYSTCVKCGGEPYVMHRSQVIYEDGKPETARMKCPKCGELLNDAQRYEMAHKQGFDNWKPTREFKGKRGFQANAMLWPHPVDLNKYPGGFMQMLAQQEIDAKNSENPKRSLRVLVNTGDAEPFDPTDETEQPPEWKVLFNRREDYVDVPVGGLVMTVMVDVQVNRLELEWKAHGRSGESWGMDHVVIDGNTKDTRIWREALVLQLKRRFKHNSGAEMGLSMCFIDGGWAAEYVFDFLKWLSLHPIEGITGKVRATKGIGKHGHPIIDHQWRTIAKQLKGYHLGTWEAKDLINQRLRKEIGEHGTPEGFMHYNKRYDEQFFQQLCTGIPTITFEKGEEVRKFLNEAHHRDEALDLAVGNLAASRLRRWNWDMIEADMKAQAELIKEGKPKPPKPPRMRHVSGGLF